MALPSRIKSGQTKKRMLTQSVRWKSRVWQLQRHMSGFIYQSNAGHRPSALGTPLNIADKHFSDVACIQPCVQLSVTVHILMKECMSKDGLLRRAVTTANPVRNATRLKRYSDFQLPLQLCGGDSTVNKLYSRQECNTASCMY
jgi:hypothetical protein